MDGIWFTLVKEFHYTASNVIGPANKFEAF